MKKAMAIGLLAILVVTFLMAAGQEQDVEELRGTLRGAIFRGDIDEAREAIKAGLDVNYKFDIGVMRGITPLIWAVFWNRRGIAELLIDAGADVKVTNEGLTLLHIASIRGNDNKAKALTELLIAKGLDVNAKAKGSRENEGSTPLHGAAGKGNIKVVEVLIKNGANVNARSQYSGSTPLDVAIQKGHKELADLLRKHGGKSGRK
ncbi:MAG: hypothetical protein GQ536_07900 [Candidatus Aminicenantes bacterium]|nr:hypothetical protein [Candidatus Aminicenantes bacterium]